MNIINTASNTLSSYSGKYWDYSNITYLGLAVSRLAGVKEKNLERPKKILSVATAVILLNSAVLTLISGLRNRNGVDLLHGVGRLSFALSSFSSVVTIPMVSIAYAISGIYDHFLQVTTVLKVAHFLNSSSGSSKCRYLKSVLGLATGIRLLVNALDVKKKSPTAANGLESTRRALAAYSMWLRSGAEGGPKCPPVVYSIEQPVDCTFSPVKSK